MGLTLKTLRIIWKGVQLCSVQQCYLSVHFQINMILFNSTLKAPLFSYYDHSGTPELYTEKCYQICNDYDKIQFCVTFSPNEWTYFYLKTPFKIFQIFFCQTPVQLNSVGQGVDIGLRDALRTTHQNQYNFFQGSFSSSTQRQRDIQSKISHQNNIIETSSLKLVINATSTRYQSNFLPSIQNHGDIA